MTAAFHLWLKPVEPLFSSSTEPDEFRANFARQNNIVFVGYPTTLSIFLYEIMEGDILVVRCGGFCGIGVATGMPFVDPNARLKNQVPHFRKVNWLIISDRGLSDYENFLRNLRIRETVRNITDSLNGSPLNEFLSDKLA